MVLVLRGGLGGVQGARVWEAQGALRCLLQLGTLPLQELPCCRVPGGTLPIFLTSGPAAATVVL